MEQQAPAGRTRFFQESDDFHGEIARAADARLAVSSSGKRYLLQRENATGLWAVVHWRKSLARLRPDIPPQLAAMLRDDLPDDPREVVRPWADELAQGRQRKLAAVPARDEYAGVIAKGKRARLVWLHASEKRGPRFALQVREGVYWRNVASSARSSGIQRLVFAPLPDDHRAAPARGDRGLQSAVVKLPFSAAFYTGRKPEKVADVDADFKRPRQSAASSEKPRKVPPPRAAARSPEAAPVPSRPAKSPKRRHGGRRSGPVIASSGRWRVALSTRRDRYWLQERVSGEDEGWALVASVQSSALLGRECFLHGAPETLLHGLPDEPREAL